MSWIEFLFDPNIVWIVSDLAFVNPKIVSDLAFVNPKFK